MKTILFFFAFTLSFFCNAQNTLTGIWLPERRIYSVVNFKRDSCNSYVDFPFKKIEFVGGNKVSILSIGTVDPFTYDLVKENPNSWTIKDTIISTDLFPIESKRVVLNISQDTLNSILITNSDTIRQKFVNKYHNLVFRNYNELEVGNLLIKDRYILSAYSDTIFFNIDGTISERKGKYKNQVKTGWNYTSYAFKVYRAECDPLRDLEIVLELGTKTNKKELYVLKFSGKKLDLYKVLSMKNRWEPSGYCYSFSLYRI